MMSKLRLRRDRRRGAGVELQLIPVLSLLVVLVPILLQTAVFEKTAAVQINLPSVDDVQFVEDLDTEEAWQTLTLTVTDEGFRLLVGGETLAEVPLSPERGLDFASLGEALANAKARYPSREDIVLLVEDGVLYDDLIHVMDGVRPLFPFISLADRVVVPPVE